jgi:hypothetical protein
LHVFPCFAVAGFLLLFLPEEAAFWTLQALVDEILPPSYYDDALTGVHTDQRVLAHLLWEIMPEVSDVFTQAGIHLHVVTLEWFMCAFCTALPTHTALRVWDAIFICGSEGTHFEPFFLALVNPAYLHAVASFAVLFRIALALIAMNRTKILSVAQSSTKSRVTVKGAVVESDGHSRSKDTVAETAQRVIAAAASIPQPDGGVTRSVSASSTGSEGGGFSPVVRGGTSRHPASTFPALYAMLKGLPASAFDPDELMRVSTIYTPPYCCP